MRCCICGKSIEKKALDPWPVSYEEDDKCCSRCYTLTVLPEVVKKQRYIEEHRLMNFVDTEFVEDGDK